MDLTKVLGSVELAGLSSLLWGSENVEPNKLLLEAKRDSNSSMMTYAEYLDSIMKGRLPMLESQYKVTISHNLPQLTGSRATGQMKSYAEAARKPFWLITALDVSMPNFGFSFNNTPVGSGFIEPYLLENSPISVAYWDTQEAVITKLINAIYQSQLGDNGLLIAGYKNVQMTLGVGYGDSDSYVISLLDGAISRPKPISVSASSNGLMRFQFTYHYEDYKIILRNTDLSVKI